jgi:hypothetical protein
MRAVLVVVGNVLAEQAFKMTFIEGNDVIQQVPRYLLRDRDAIFGEEFQRQVTDMGIHEVLSAPRSPWPRAYVERVIGSLRRECLDQVIVFREPSLRRILASYFELWVPKTLSDFKIMGPGLHGS